MHWNKLNMKYLRRHFSYQYLSHWVYFGKFFPRLKPTISSFSCDRRRLVSSSLSRYQAFTLLLTFLAYTSYHMSRKPISIVKNELLNCTEGHNHTVEANCTSFISKNGIAFWTNVFLPQPFFFLLSSWDEWNVGIWGQEMGGIAGHIVSIRLCCRDVC